MTYNIVLLPLDAFKDGSSIPVEHTCDGEDSPPRTLMGQCPRRHTVHRPDSRRSGRTRQNMGPHKQSQTYVVKLIEAVVKQLVAA